MTLFCPPHRPPPPANERYINKVTVQDLQTRHVFHFFCDCWMSSDHGDRMTKKTFNAAKTNEIACFRSEMFHFTPACCCVANFFCHDCVFFSFPLSEIFSRAEHPLALGMNTSGCPSWILPHVVLSHVHSEFPAACACSSAPWLSTLLSGTFL